MSFAFNHAGEQQLSLFDSYNNLTERENYSNIFSYQGSCENGNLLIPPFDYSIRRLHCAIFYSTYIQLLFLANQFPLCYNLKNFDGFLGTTAGSGGFQ